MPQSGAITCCRLWVLAFLIMRNRLRTDSGKDHVWRAARVAALSTQNRTLTCDICDVPPLLLQEKRNIKTKILPKCTWRVISHSISRLAKVLHVIKSLTPIIPNTAVWGPGSH